MHFSADSHSTPHFSLLVTTRNRRGPFIRLLESLVVQKYPYFTVLLGDQNPPQFLADILQHYSTKLDIDYRLITPKGLSAARNQLLPHVKGDIVALTDDDCHYSPDTLLKVANFFFNKPSLFGLHWLIHPKIACTFTSQRNTILRVSKSTVMAYFSKKNRRGTGGRV